MLKVQSLDPKSDRSNNNLHSKRHSTNERAQIKPNSQIVNHYQTTVPNRKNTIQQNTMLLNNIQLQVDPSAVRNTQNQIPRYPQTTNIVTQATPRGRPAFVDQKQNKSDYQPVTTLRQHEDVATKMSGNQEEVQNPSPTQRMTVPTEMRSMFNPSGQEIVHTEYRDGQQVLMKEVPKHDNQFEDTSLQRSQQLNIQNNAVIRQYKIKESTLTDQMNYGCKVDTVSLENVNNNQQLKVEQDRRYLQTAGHKNRQQKLYRYTEQSQDVIIEPVRSIENSSGQNPFINLAQTNYSSNNED